MNSDNVILRGHVTSSGPTCVIIYCVTEQITNRASHFCQNQFVVENNALLLLYRAMQFVVFLFIWPRDLTPSTPAVSNCCCSKSPKRQSARMSKNKNGGLDQYGKVQSLNGIGGERVNTAIYKNSSASGGIPRPPGRASFLDLLGTPSSEPLELAPTTPLRRCAR